MLVLAKVKGNKLTVEFIHLEYVTYYAAHIDHLVLDLNCKLNSGC